MPSPPASLCCMLHSADQSNERRVSTLFLLLSLTSIASGPAFTVSEPLIHVGRGNDGR